MKNYFIYILMSSLIHTVSIAQVGIGNTNPKASLDISASNPATPTNTDGILIPRINAFPVTAPTAVQNGMMVFLTTDNSFYFWRHSTTTWVKITGTGAEKINDLSDGRSDDDGSENGSSIYLGIASGVNDDLSDNGNVGIGLQAATSNTTGEENIAIGVQALTTSSTSSFNTAIGSFALQNTTKGSNTAIGRSSLSSNTLGEENVAIGALSSTDNTDGSFNTVVGYGAGRFNKTGNNNTLLGYEAGFITALNTNKTGVIAIGYQAGKDRNRSNSLFIENSDADENNALIYGEFDTNLLRVNGELQISNPSTTGFIFPTTRGTNNQVLKTNASGVLTWTDDVDGTDHDFYKVGTTLPPTTINDDIFTNGKIGINKAVPTSSLDLVDTRGTTAFNVFIDDTGAPSNTATYGIKMTIDNDNGALSTGNTTGILNAIEVLNEGIGVENIISSGLVSNGNLYGTKQTLTNEGSGEAYGIYNTINGTSSGSKYGSYNKVEDLPATGTNYGVYSESLIGFAGYFLGKVSIGRNTTNTYSFPDSRAVGNGEIMVSDATGIVTWNKFTNLGWGTRGNSGLDITQDFIGTTDNVALSFRTNDTQKMLLTTNGILKIITAVDDEALLKNANTFNDVSDANIDFSVNETKDAWMVSSREGTSDNSGIYGNRDFITMWSPGDSNRIVRFLDEDSWIDNDGDPYNNTAEKAYIDSNGQFVQASDKNRKQNFKTISNPLQKMTELNGYTYAYKNNSTEKYKGEKLVRTSGVIAQELYEVLPEAVQISENGEYFVHYAGIIPLLIEAIKEQQKEIDKLKNLEERILKLESNSN